MKVCRFKHRNDETRVGVVLEDGGVRDLTPAGVSRLSQILESGDPAAAVTSLKPSTLPQIAVADLRLLAPVEQQEVWAAGVTYLRSKTARMEESDFSATAYDRVYDAERPELFFKALADKVVGPGDAVGIRRDSTWNVPEPELALVVSSHGRVVGYTIGNDMSSRDIEGENLLYLPQAKMYHRSCAVGPWITLGASEAAVRQWTIRLEIRRGGTQAFAGETSVANIKRGFDELTGFLCRSQVFPHGAVLLTGTGVVPDDTFTLQERDVVSIEISGIGVLENSVMVV